MKTNLILFVLAFLPIILNGQKCNTDDKKMSEYTVQELIDAKQLVVNIQLVKNVQDFQPEEGYTSFIDIYKNLSNPERIQFLREYRTSNLNNESLKDVKKRAVDLVNNSNQGDIKLSDEDIEWYKQVKAEMSLKLNSFNDFRTDLKNNL